jgi:hypothetical protein
MKARREKVFGPGRAVPLDGNAKARIADYAKAWSARNKQPHQHKGRSPAPSWRSLRRCCVASTTAAPVPASRPTRRLPPRRSAIAAPWRRP